VAVMGIKRLALAALALGVAVTVTTACSRSPSGRGDAGPPPAPRPGEIAPDFSLPSATGGTLALTEFRGESPVLLYFSMGPG
jgi:hypothetical protein